MGHLCTIAFNVAIGLAVTLSGSLGLAGLNETVQMLIGQQSAIDNRQSTIDNGAPQPTAEELLKELQRKRPINEVIPPASAADRTAQSARRALLPEGTAVVDRSGWLANDGRWWSFVLGATASSSATHEPPMKLLPNAALEVMTRTETGSASPVKFVVSGETTVFEHENYLLVRVVRRALETAGLPVRPKQTAEGTEPSRADKPPADEQSARQDTPPGTILSADAPVENVIAMLQQQQPEAVLQVPPPRLSDQAARDATVVRTFIPDGSPLVRRPGRIVRDGDWWFFVFESDHPDHVEPKMKLLPNQSVELMVRASQRENNGLVFIVSGEVTLFQNDNFLLPRVATRRIDTGNLRK